MAILGGVALLTAGNVVTRSAQSLRQRAVWWYNRQWAPEGGGRSP
jgi:hypothetical protein